VQLYRGLGEASLRVQEQSFAGLGVAVARVLTTHPVLAMHQLGPHVRQSACSSDFS
jgi:hypothetical protein